MARIVQYRGHVGERQENESKLQSSKRFEKEYPMAQKLIPPFDSETAAAKVQAAEDAWNSRDPESVARAYSEDSQWRNRDEFLIGREAINGFLRRKWAKEECH